MDTVQVGVNPKGGGDVGVPHLGASLHHIHAGQVQQRAERVPQPVQRDGRNGHVQRLRARLA